MRRIPLLLFVLLSTLLQAFQSHAQTKSTSSTTSVDQLVAKINADIKAKKATEQIFYLVRNPRSNGATWREVSSRELDQIRTQEFNEQVDQPREYSPELRIWRRSGSVVCVKFIRDFMDTQASNEHYFRSDGSLAKFVSVGTDHNGYHGTPQKYEVASRFDVSGRRLNLTKSATGVGGGRDPKTGLKTYSHSKIPFSWQPGMSEKPLLMNISELGSRKSH
jgi:hypothetical protein